MDPVILIYRCAAGHDTATAQVDPGEPALALPCSHAGCWCWAVQRDPQPEPDEAAGLVPTVEWYRPTPEETKRLNPTARYWIGAGGLLRRNATPKPMEATCKA